MPKTMLWTYINFAIDNSFGLKEIGTIDNDMLLSTWESFVILFPMWGFKYLPFSQILLATYT